jgi:hypothetical protein
MKILQMVRFLRLQVQVQVHQSFVSLNADRANASVVFVQSLYTYEVIVFNTPSSSLPNCRYFSSLVAFRVLPQN